jgi:RNA polymerase sigma-70 factor (ECF subfamily)
MSDDFAQFIRRIRAGDPSAAEELVRLYEPVVLMEVRSNLKDPRLRRLLDSRDIMQSVFASLFVRVAAGQFELNKPENLAGLLVVMVRNTVAYHARRQSTQKRGGGRIIGLDPTHEAVADEPSPSEVFEGKELLDEFRRRLSPEERQLAELRGEGYGWAEIADRVGGTAQARRVQFSRAVDRVADQLGLAEVYDE